MQKQTSMRDYAKDKVKTPFVRDYERAQRIVQEVAYEAIEAKGWLNRIIHAIAGKPIFGNWN